MAGRLTLSKFVVVEYVTLSFGWFAVSGSRRAWWKFFVHIRHIAWSSGDEAVIVERIQWYDVTKSRGNELSLDENRVMIPAVYVSKESGEGADNLTWCHNLTLYDGS
jgi:hypothetical protein